MKKLLSLALVLALMLSLGVSAFAMVIVNGYSKQDGEVSVESAQFVEAKASGDKLTVTGNVTGDGNRGHDSVKAEGGSEINVGGSVTESGDGNAITADGATVVVVGNVTKESGDGNAITANNSAKVAVGEDVKGHVVATAGATVVVEGTVIGVIDTDELGNVYIGKLESEIGSEDLNRVHYLIGVVPDEDSEQFGKNVSISGVTKAVDGLYGRTYYGTKNGETITLKSNVEGKQVKITANLPETATYDPETGILTLGDGFKGGLKDLVLVLVDKAGPEPVPVYYVVPTGSVTVVEFKAPDGIEEGLIKVLDSADHAGLTLDKSLLAEGYDHSVKVTLNGEELPEGAYRFVINWDGSLSLILSTTYLKTLGDGSYDFTATVDELVIPFTVVVAE